MQQVTQRRLICRFLIALTCLLQFLFLHIVAASASLDKRIVGYFVQWGIYARKYEPADIPAESLTHINYAFLEVNESTGELRSIDPWADMQIVFNAKNGLPAQTWEQSSANRAGNFGRLRDLKALHPHLKVLFSVGGWTLSAPFPAVAADPIRRQAFADSAAAWVSEQGFDGIDIDWEYPSLADKDNFTALMETTRQALDQQGQRDGKTYLLTIAAPAGAAKLAALDLSRLADVLDWINVMTYDYSGGWQSTTAHHAPLFRNPVDPSPDSATLNVDWTMRAYIDGGFPAAKLHMGLPFYGRSWEQVAATSNGLFQSGRGGPGLGVPGNWETGVFDYWKILELLDGGTHQAHLDAAAAAPYVYGPNLSSASIGGMFITYETIDSLDAKLEWADQQGLGGVMFWELSGDLRDVNDPRSLLGRIGAAKPPQPRPNPIAPLLPLLLE